MKKWMSVLLMLSFCLSMVGCGASAPTPENEGMEASSSATAPETASETTPEIPAEVAITMDNWDDYFDLVPAADVYTDETGAVQYWTFCYGIVLREEYAQRYTGGHVDFEIRYDEELRDFTGDLETGNYTLGEAVKSGNSSQGKTKTVGMQDLRQDNTISPLSDFYGTVSAVIYCGALIRQENGSAVAPVPVNGEILHAEGNLSFGN